MREPEKHTLMLKVPEGQNPVRADAYICEHITSLSRSQFSRREAKLFINGREVKPSRKVHPGDEITLIYADLPPLDMVPEEIPMKVLYEDERVIVVNKDPGIVVHPGAGNYSGTLVQGILHRCSGMLSRFPEETPRPGIVHRLDKDTSGTIIIAKDIEAHEFLARQFHDRRTRKVYIAVVRGVPKELKGSVTSRIARDRVHRKRFLVLPEENGRGRTAKTAYRVLARYDGYSLMQLVPVTGRTHQLRVHMKHLGCPIVSDPIYGREEEQGMKPGLLLHAFSLSITLPGGQARMFRSPLPVRFKEFIRSVNA